MAPDRRCVVCAADRIPSYHGIIFSVMEMWKTAAYADGKPIHSLWKRTDAFLQGGNRFPTALPVCQFTHIHATPVATNIDPILSCQILKIERK